MNSKELVLRTLEFENPDRIPRQMWILPWAQQNYPKELANIQNCFPDDIINSAGFLKKKPQTKGNPFNIGTYIDEWGCEFINKQAGIIGEVKKPLVKTWDDLEKVIPPTDSLSVNNDAVNKFCKNSEKFILAGCCPRPFERLQFLRGTENVLMDLALQSKEIYELLDMIHQFNLKELQAWARTDVDALMFMDDWGTQISMLISPEIWRLIFKPLYKEYIQIAHDNGKKAFMHSDGYIIDIIPDLIELGLDALNSQIFCMGLEQLGQKFKGKITFWGEMDRQYKLPKSTTDQIAHAVKSIYENLYQNGGIIAQLEFGPGVKPQNVVATFEAWNSIC